MRSTLHAVVLLGAAVTALSGCATRIGARSLPDVRSAYNESVAQSSNEQMLLNLVRLRYSHPVQFLEPVSVVTTYSFSRNLGLAGNGNLNGENSFASIAGGALSGGLSATETPTITYTPLAGEQFVRRLASPLPRDLLWRLLQGGWPADHLLPITVSRFGPARAPVISAPDDNNPFSRIVSDLTTLQADGSLIIDVDHPAGVVIEVGEGAVGDRLLASLGVAEDLRRFTVSGHLVDAPETDVPMLTRSMMDVLFYLSHGVAVSPNDAAARDLGVPLPIAEPLLDVRRSNDRPATAFVAVPYEGEWFWIDNTDRSTKSVFGSMRLLMSIMAAPGEIQTPVLTLPR